MSRNGNKRYSGVFDSQPISGDSSTTATVGVTTGIVRRTSKKGSNRDRQGHVYTSEDFRQDTSIRPTTPDCSSSTATTTSAGNDSSLYGSPQSISSTNRPSEASTLRSNALRFDTTNDRPANGATRPRTRTLDERARKTSFESKVRNRLGSVHALPTNVTASQAPELKSSIGFPSIVSGSPASQRQRPAMKSPPRPLSPAAEIDPAFLPGIPSPNNDTERILHLMRTTAGRMHGILYFRTSKTAKWSSGYCAINVASGTLIYQMKGDVSHAKTLIPDLRGCVVRTQLEQETNSHFLEIKSRTSEFDSNDSPGFVVHLRPFVAETFDSWLAALLCWQPVSPRTAPTTPVVAGPTVIQPGSQPSLTSSRRNSGANLLRDAAIIKVGKMLYWDRNIPSSEPPAGAQRISTYKQQRSASGTPWRKVSCTLQENGLLKLYKDPDPSLLHQIPLSALNKFAIQRLHPTVLEDEYCLAIYPQYTASRTSALCLEHPIYLSLENRILYEVWFVLLRAFTTPELYGPEQPSVRASIDLTAQTQRSIPSFGQLFRVERVLSLRIIEAKVFATPTDSSNIISSPTGRARSTNNNDFVIGDYHAEAIMDGETRGRTAIKQRTGNPFWREEYQFDDLPPVISNAAVLVKSRSPVEKDWFSVTDVRTEPCVDINQSLGVIRDVRVSPMDTTIGRIDLRLDEFERGKDYEQWWNIAGHENEVKGEILMKIRIDEAVVLMSKHYQPILEMLKKFSSGLTQQIAFAVPWENRKLHEGLLNVFQSTGDASNWLMSLVEDEIDGIHKDTPAPRYRYSRRIASNDSYDSGVERELVLRDAGKNATQEANLLFRGNSLLTKALDFHMRRLGKEYLDEALGERIRDIDESDPDCEVDPNRIRPGDDLQRNWRNLIALTESVWIAIKTQPARCPPELRAIFRHIRACADDRYGAFLRNIKYSSVSGFLFLRFFCPAILNPKLFGLLKDHPRPRALRTLTFIAKSLQCLANLSTFGSKELWMEPMNQFITTHRQEFKDYIDEICRLSPDQTTLRVPPSYATPLKILERLPQTAKEGFPSLPYLVDQSRELAALTNAWIEATGDHRPTELDGEDIVNFDRLCYVIREQTKLTIDSAMRADQPSGAAVGNLEGLAETLDRQIRASSTIVGPDSTAAHAGSKPTSPTSTTSPVAALVRTAKRLRLSQSLGTSSASNGSGISLPSDREAPVSPIASYSGTGGRASPWAPSPSASTAPSVAEWDPSDSVSTEQYPSHALSWDKSGAQNGTNNFQDTELIDAESDTSSVRKPIAGRPGTPNAQPPRSSNSASGQNTGGLKIPFNMSTSTHDERSPVSPREQSSGRKLSDVWSFRRKDKDKDKDKTNTSAEQLSRHENNSGSSARRGTLTKKEREKRVLDLQNAKTTKEGKDQDGKGKGKSKK